LLWQTELVDLVLKQLWQQQPFDELSLVAVGGYGRCELHPKSDVDIGVLVPDDISGDIQTALADWLTQLWDLGLDIGHSVRSVNDCEEQARADITVVTNLMEARLLCGDEVKFKAMQACIAPNNMWPSDEFFAAKFEEQEQRRERFDANAYKLEPNVKESQGGLRDIQTISWVCHRQFGTGKLRDLVKLELLTEEESDVLEEGMLLLWRIRYLLHHFAGRREDRLLFDYQRDIAHAFGYSDDEQNRSIEALMQRFYRSVMALQRLNDILLQGIGGVISGVTAATEPEAINSRFQVRNGFLETTHDDVFMHDPAAMLELFLIFGNTPQALKVRSNTVRQIRANLPLINERFRSDSRIQQLFLQIFSNPNRLTRKIRLMNVYGVMAAYLPAFDEIVGRMQYDLFHVYTVDEHTLRVIRNLRRFALEEFADELPHCSFVMQQIDYPEQLYLAALFHDIAKGRGGDHSVLGAEDAHAFCQAHNMDDEDVDLISWIVRQHLAMSNTSQRKDITDPDVVREFAELVGDMDRLNHLYLLTVADIRATNPELWNSFKESLLTTLYQSTATLLQQGVDNAPDTSDTLEHRKSHTQTMLADTDLQASEINQFWQQLDDDYFKQYQAAEIARHTLFILQHAQKDQPNIQMRHSVSRGANEILIYTRDHKALFALITSALGQLQLDIQSASINTTADGFALDTFYVLDYDGSIIADELRIEQIRDTLQSSLSNTEQLPDLAAGKAPRRLQHFRIRTRIRFVNHDGAFTQIHISTADRPGILSTIAGAFLKCGVSVQSAKILTLGEKIDDIFFVLDENGQEINDAAQRNFIKATLSDLL